MRILNIDDLIQKIKDSVFDRTSLIYQISESSDGSPTITATNQDDMLPVILRSSSVRFKFDFSMDIFLQFDIANPHSRTLRFVDWSIDWGIQEESGVFRFPGHLFSKELASAIIKVEPSMNWDVPILIEGEEGVGKRVLAESIHMNSNSEGQFVVFDCRAKRSSELSPLLESFQAANKTSADNQRTTLYLDQLDQLDDVGQHILIEFLDAGSTIIQRDSVTQVRLIAGSNRHLASAVDDRSFRRGLYDKLSMCRISLRSLRSQRDSILPLFRAFISQQDLVSKLNGKAKSTFLSPKPLAVADDVKDTLTSYSWPGNVEELRSFASVCAMTAQDRNCDVTVDLVKELSRDYFNRISADDSLSSDVLQVPDPDPSNPVWQMLLNYPWAQKFDIDYPVFWNLIDDKEYYDAVISKHASEWFDMVVKTRLEPPGLSKLLNALTWPAVMRDVVLLRVVLAFSRKYVAVAPLAFRLGYVHNFADTAKRSGTNKIGGLGKHCSRLCAPKDVRRDPRKHPFINEEDLNWILKKRERLG